MPDDLPGHKYISWANLEPRTLIGPDGATARLDPARVTCRTIVDDGTAQRAATLAGAGLSINSLWSVAHEPRAGRLVRVLPDWRLNDGSVLWLVYPRSNVLTPKTRVFMDFMIKRIGSSLGAGPGDQNA